MERVLNYWTAKEAAWVRELRDASVDP